LGLVLVISSKLYDQVFKMCDYSAKYNLNIWYTSNINPSGTNFRQCFPRILSLTWKWGSVALHDWVKPVDCSTLQDVSCDTRWLLSQQTVALCKMSAIIQGGSTSFWHCTEPDQNIQLADTGLLCWEWWINGQVEVYKNTDHTFHDLRIQ